MRYVFLVLLLLLAVVLVLFGVQNPQPVTVRLLSFEASNLSLSLVVIISAIAGAALVGLLSAWGSIQGRIRGRRDSKLRADLEARNRDLERELAALKGGPVSQAPRASVPAGKK